jgi:predicted dehydrogenase
MSKKRYRAAIIGLSPIGGGPPHPAPSPALGTLMARTHAAAYAHLKDTVEIVAYCDLRDDRLDLFKQNWGEVWPDAKPYKDYHKMFENEGLDIVSVVTPDDLHGNIVVDAAEAGIPTILCEKPLATTLEDLDRMLAAIEANGTAVNIDMTLRWFPNYRMMHHLIDQGAIGKPRIITTVSGGPRAGMLFRNGCGPCDTILWFADSTPAWVVGRLQDTFQNYGPAYAADGGHDPATDPAPKPGSASVTASVRTIWASRAPSKHNSSTAPPKSSEKKAYSASTMARSSIFTSGMAACAARLSIQTL